MPTAINKTFSLTSKHIILIDELCEESNFNGSRLLKSFINYFKANPNEFQKIMDGDYED